MNAQTSFVLGALIVVSAVVAAHQSAPTGRVGDADTICAKKGEPHELKRISGRDWEVRIGLDPCVSVADAKKILGAINEKRMVNRQRPFAQGTCKVNPRRCQNSEWRKSCRLNSPTSGGSKRCRKVVLRS